MPAASFVPLAKYRGQTVKIEVEHHPAEESGQVEWRSLELVPSRDLVPVDSGDGGEGPGHRDRDNPVRGAGASIFAALKNPKPPRINTYTIVADTDLPEISAIRLELLPDPRLPRTGRAAATVMSSCRSSR